MVKTPTTPATFEEIDTPPLPTTTLTYNPTAFETHAPSLKTIEEVRTALVKNYESDYQGKIELKGKFKYVPWDQAAALANRIFGVDGYDVEILKTWREEITGPSGETTYGYAATVRLIVHVIDNGEVRHIIRDGLGFNEMEFTNSGRAMIDPAIKGAASGALLRALVLLGDAFGLYLYDGPPAQSNTVTSQSNGTYTQAAGGTSPLTPGQINVVVQKFNTTPEAVVAATSTRTKDQLKTALDKLFSGTKPWELSEEFGGLEYIKKGAAAPSSNGTRDKLPIPV